MKGLYDPGSSAQTHARESRTSSDNNISILPLCRHYFYTLIDAERRHVSLFGQQMCQSRFCPMLANSVSYVKLHRSCAALLLVLNLSIVLLVHTLMMKLRLPGLISVLFDEEARHRKMEDQTQAQRVIDVGGSPQSVPSHVVCV
jgi:hypothetical protein